MYDFELFHMFPWRENYKNQIGNGEKLHESRQQYMFWSGLERIEMIESGG